MGARRATNDKATAWAESAGASASHGTFADAAAFGEILFNCTAGTGALAALESARAENLAGKILIDVANPLDFSKGMPPTLFLSNDTSLGETIQRTFPEARVVKALNTVNAIEGFLGMTEASAVPLRGQLAGSHDAHVTSQRPPSAGARRRSKR